MDVSAVSGHPAVSGPLHINKSLVFCDGVCLDPRSFFDEGLELHLPMGIMLSA